MQAKRWRILRFRILRSTSPAPPRGKAVDELEPPDVVRITACKARLRHPWPAPVGNLDPDNVIRRLDRDRDRPDGSS
jgi:hypothetical protein